MIEAGEDPEFIARRMVVFASEDVGLADPQALVVAVAAAHALALVGLPEATYNLSEAAILIWPLLPSRTPWPGQSDKPVTPWLAPTRLEFPTAAIIGSQGVQVPP